MGVIPEHQKGFEVESATIAATEQKTPITQKKKDGRFRRSENRKVRRAVFRVMHDALSWHANHSRGSAAELSAALWKTDLSSLTWEVQSDLAKALELPVSDKTD